MPTAFPTIGDWWAQPTLQDGNSPIMGPKPAACNDCISSQTESHTED